MSVIEIIMAAFLLVMGVFLVITMMLQKNEKGLSGTIAGGTDTYLSGQGAKDRKSLILTIITAVVAVIFVLVVFAAYVFQPNFNQYVIGNEWQTSSEFFKNLPELPQA